MLERRGVSPIIATALLVVVTVIALTSFQSWFDNFESGIAVVVEESSRESGVLKVEALFDNELYLYSSEDSVLDFLKVVDERGKEVCYFEFVDESFLDKGLIAYFSFDEGVGSVVENGVSWGNDGFLGGGVDNYPLWVEGRVGGALKFDGENDFVTIPDYEAIHLMSESFSVSMWKKVDSRVRQMFLFHGLGCNQWSSWIMSVGGNEAYPNPGKYSFNFNAGGKKVYSSGNVISDEWVHLVGTYDGSELRLYINGVLNNSAVASGIPVNRNVNLYIGADPGCGIRGPINGTLDEIRIYNRTLSEDEVEALYSTEDLISEGKVRQGLNRFDVSSCDLVFGGVYNVVGVTGSGKVDMQVVAK